MDAKPKKINTLVREACSKHGLSTNDLAALLGVSPHKLTGWTEGDSYYTPPNKYQMAAILLLAKGVSPASIMVDTPQYVKSLMDANGVTATKLAKAMGVSANVVYNYTTRLKNPNLAKSIRIREGVMLAREMKGHLTDMLDKERARMVAKMVEVAGGDTKRLAAMIGCTNRTVQRWVKGTTQVPASAVVAMAAIKRGVRADDLHYTGDALREAAAGDAPGTAMAIGISPRSLYEYRAYGPAELPARIKLALDEALHRRKCEMGG